MHRNVCWHGLREVTIINIIIIVILVIVLIIDLFWYLFCAHFQRIRNCRLPHQVAASSVIERNFDL